MAVNSWTFYYAAALVGVCSVGSSIPTSTITMQANNSIEAVSMAWESSVNSSTPISTFALGSLPDVKSFDLDNNEDIILSNNTTSDDRIVGGRNTYISKYPYQLQMLRYGQPGCGGSIISAYWVITAAHCVFREGDAIPLDRMSFISGSTYRATLGKVHTVERCIVPKKYDPDSQSSNEYDIALMKVKNPFQFNYLVQPITLQEAWTEVEEGSTATITGWGLTTDMGQPSRILQEVQVPVVSHSGCRGVYAAGGRTIISRRMICAGGRYQGACQGDSGGPMVVDGKLVGVVSFGRICGDPRSPGVFTKISEYRTFIKQVTGV